MATNAEIWDAMPRQWVSLKWGAMTEQNASIADGFAEAVRADERQRMRCASGSAKPAPKPRRTGGQKVFNARWPGHNWPPILPSDREGWEIAAKELGIPDDPEPPSDGELMEKAHNTTSPNAEWSTVAAEFLRLRAERDGGAA